MQILGERAEQKTVFKLLKRDCLANTNSKNGSVLEQNKRERARK